ncbi:MAG: hypothetical protein KGM43_05265 [Planctomycetota bacterium]|nr:hypothetical protein [Planctomycetota bacterium]
MIRTGYLRWEIEAGDAACAADPHAREASFLARPTYRRVRVKSVGHVEAAARFIDGDANYDEVLRTLRRDGGEVDVEIPNVGPRIFRYSEADRAETPRFWLVKLQREAAAFAVEVVRAAASFPQMVISSPALRAGYARLVEAEILRAVAGVAQAAPTIEDEPMRIDADAYHKGVPELVAAELVRDVVDRKEFDEFCTYDRVTVRNGDHFYRISRRPHGLVEVWDATTLRPVTRLCIAFKDPGMPPSDEVVMKYLLAKHQPEMLWKIGVRFSPPTGRFDAAGPRRWKLD